MIVAEIDFAGTEQMCRGSHGTLKIDDHDQNP